MKKDIHSLSIVLKPGTLDGFKQLLKDFLSWEDVGDKKIFFESKKEEEIKKHLKIPSHVSFLPWNKLLTSCDLIVSMGGDGTLIGIGRSCDRKTPPVFGIDMGHLGFITEFSIPEFKNHLRETLQGRYEVRKIPLFKAIIKRDEKTLSGFFINDAVINKRTMARITTLSVNTQKDPIYQLLGDGLIIGTPLGSTAYSLAAGGPVIHPQINSLILTPICSHDLINAPLILPENLPLTIKVEGLNEKINLTLDGQEVFIIDERDTLTIVKNFSRTLSLVKNPKRNYFQTLREKIYLKRRRQKNTV